MVLCTFPLFSQKLTVKLNLLRPGDALQVREIPFISADREGQGLVWDLSKEDYNSYRNIYNEYIYLDTDSVLHYSTPYADKTYALRGDTLLCTGYSTKNLNAEYFLADEERAFPVCYGDSIESIFYGEGFYSQKLHFVSYGHTKRKITSTGKLILPDADTLRNVLLLYESSVLGQCLSTQGGIKSNGNSQCYATDTIINRLENDSVVWHVDTWSWYASGYRYPILKSIRNCIIERDSERMHFERSYYYPPEEWVLAEVDRENEEERIRLQNEKDYWDEVSEDAISVDYTYSMCGGILEVNLELGETSEVELIAATQQGYILARSPKETLPAGSVVRRLDVSSAQPGIFIFSAIVNGRVQSSKITKS